MIAIRDRHAVEREEAERLAPFAVRSGESLGRVHPEPDHPYRTAFQRDRDRIVHSRAFRRLEYKTQVFVYHEGDHYRNRLTHTLEGSQISRTIARALRLNEDLANDGGFDHNRQSLRIVDLLEDRYPAFRGLNLTSETREGILKHGCHWEHPVPVPALMSQPSLEAQVVDLADEIAYTNHDLDDGLRSALLGVEVLAEVRLWRETREQVVAEQVGANEAVLQAETVRAIINRLVTDLIESSSARLAEAGVGSVDGVRRIEERLIGYSPEIESAKRELKRFLYQNLYHHPRVRAVSDNGARILADLFKLFRDDPSRLPVHVRERFAGDGLARAIADYAAGMTDRFAMGEHERLLGAHDRR
jgi:dGTPase